MESKRLKAITESGRPIGTYEISDAMLLFKGAATVKNGKVVIDEKRCGAIDEDHGWRAIREHDGSASYWTPDAFERRFGIAFALNISTMDDARRFAERAAKMDPDRLRRAHSRKPKGSRKPNRESGVESDKAASDDNGPEAGQHDRYAHSHTRDIPPALGYHWRREGGNIYCVDDDGNRITESYLKSEIEVYWSDLELEKKAASYRADDIYEPSWDQDDYGHQGPIGRYGATSTHETARKTKPASGRRSEVKTDRVDGNTADRNRSERTTPRATPKATPTDEYAHSHTRPIPPKLGYSWIRRNGNIYCLDMDGRRITEADLKADIETWMGMVRQGKEPATRESREHAELRRRNEEIMNKAMREHRNDHLKPAGWEATQRHNEEKAREKQLRTNKKKREEAASRKREAAAKKKAEAESKRSSAGTAVSTDAPNPAIGRANAPAHARKSPSSSMTDKQCLLKALNEIQDPFVADAVKSMFHSIDMMGIVERALMLLRGNPREDKPVSLDPFATENIIRYRYCKTDNARLYCFRVVAEAIACKVSDADAEGPMPYIWALENSKDKQGARKRAAMSILNDTEHLILFSDDIVHKASACIDELTILPYPTTLVRIEGIPNTWGAVAYESSKGIEIATIGERPCEKAARRLLAYIQNHCAAQTHDSFRIDFETTSTDPEAESGHFAEPTAPRPTAVDQRTHFIKSEAVKKAKAVRTQHRKSPESIAPYTRRAHLRHQRYGKGNSLVKIIQIAPTVVKPRGGGTVPFEQRVHVVV